MMQRLQGQRYLLFHFVINIGWPPASSELVAMISAGFQTLALYLLRPASLRTDMLSARIWSKWPTL